MSDAERDPDRATWSERSDEIRRLRSDVEILSTELAKVTLVACVACDTLSFFDEKVGKGADTVKELLVEFNDGKIAPTRKSINRVRRYAGLKPLPKEKRTR